MSGIVCDSGECVLTDNNIIRFYFYKNEKEEEEVHHICYM